jgi:hypothetical protein
MLLIRFLVVILVLATGLGSSWGRVHPILAEVPAQGEPQAAGVEPVPFEATLGEPADINQAPKDSEAAPESPQTLPPGKHPATPDRTLPNQPDSYWTEMMNEDWEGVWPEGSPGWAVYDNNGTTGGNLLWDDDDFKPRTGLWSAWPANGGTDGVDPQYNNYRNDMESWMVYGPFDLSNCAQADFDFWYWNKSEDTYDWLGWAASPNGVNFYGYQISGDQSTWNYVDFNLAPYLGDSSVWLMFRFTSDYTVTDIGAFIDDVRLWCLTDTTTVSWTFMVYLDGDNNLEAAAIDDFLEMSSVGSSSNVSIVVQMDRISGYSTAYDDWTDTRRFHITPGMTPTIANSITAVGEANMGDPETLLHFIRWGRAAYPANNYAVVLWDHGSGWKLRDPDQIIDKGIIYDDTNSDNITMPEMRSVLSVFTNTGTNPIELFGMDACLMAMIEVDNQIKPYADVRVGSQETEPADGWPYNTILSGLVANPSWTASQLATRIVDDFYTSHGNNNTQSAVNLGSLYSSLNNATNNFANALIAWAPYYRIEITNARNAAQTFSTSTYIDLWDFADWVRIYTENATLDSTSQAVEDAVMAAVIREQSGSSWPWAQGISIYFPKTAAEYDARYDGSSGFLEFTAGTSWDEWVHVYHNLANYPANFNKSSPENDASNQLLSLNLSWEASTGATGFEYCIDTTNDNACNTSWVSTGSSTSASISSLSPSTTYYWQVRAVNATGTLYANTAPTAYWSFTTGFAPETFSKANPTNAATGQLLSLNLVWGSSSGVSSYEYCYDTSNDNACSGWTNAGIATSVPIGPLSPATTYYWHVRALNSFGTTYSNGSATTFWSFTTGPLPGIFSKVSPSNLATGQPLSLTLTWEASSNASSYEYCYDTTNDNACSGWTSTGGATSIGLSGLSTGTTYYWHVRALNNIGTTYANGSATAFWPFTTGSPPGVFNKLNPSNSATSVSTNPSLSWGTSSGAINYEYCYDTTNDNACSSWTSNGSATSVGISGLSAGTTYYWHARALNSFGTTYTNGSATAYWSFTTGFPPESFTKTAPGNGAGGQPISLTLSWSASTYAQSYEYCYDTTNDNTCSGWASTGTNNSVAISGLSYGTTYFWQVRALNGFGITYADGGLADFWSFTTGLEPGTFGKISPGDGATGQPTSLTLTWSASNEAAGYEYCYDTSNDNACSSWVSTGTTTSAALDFLAFGTTYYWQVRAVNGFGTTYADGLSTAYWSFTTGSPPENFTKVSPGDGVIDQPLSLTLDWDPSVEAASYEYCYDTIDNHECDGGWVSVGLNTSAVINGLSDDTTYFWQVRALNPYGSMYADSESWWSFTTIDIPTFNVYLPFIVLNR